ncbi:MAG: HAD hydrolase-like protein [Verrucomicrobiota bacterium]
MKRLFLLDIDCTLVNTGGAGLRAIQQAFLDVFELDPSEAPTLDLAGSTDRGILRNYLAETARAETSELRAQFFESYLPQLQANLAPEDHGGKVLAGVPELLRELAADPEHTLGLLTGNVAKGADIKLRRYGLDPWFSFGAFGDDHWDRNQLGPIALERAREKTGHSFSSEQTYVVGDTPKDIACGKAFGAITVAVATGNFTEAELQAHEPDFVLSSLVEFQKRVLVGSDRME